MDDERALPLPLDDAVTLAAVEARVDAEDDELELELELDVAVALPLVLYDT
jgi:hypothetical protein